MSGEDDVLAAARALVAAFGRHDTDAYFDAFAPEATFLFYTHDTPLRSRQAYREVWSSWENEGFRVLACESDDQHVQALGDDVAVFTHRVETTVRSGAVEERLDERETIVFQRGSDGRWVAVHEHLSPSPTT
ncbi:SgcJ/EcaC family oxidoreductase [Terrabacter sp. NPDC080008]|uniref:YybH family protein n=1 Tax=Terrabacter sp. NPDC080008 TaxID=3155176 RepID=UPI00344BA1AE